MGDYGRDIESSLVELLKKIIPISGDSQIALRYIHPQSLIRQYKDLEPYFESKKICYFNSSFQSGSPKVLKLMNRPENINTFIELISEISAKYPSVNRHACVIVGFPGETERDFNQTLNIAKKDIFNNIDVYMYSKRPGTKAFNMKNHISKNVMKSRYKKLLELRKEKFKKLIYDELLNQFSI